jgi:chaperonin GroEL
MSKTMLFNQDASDAIRRGVHTLSSTVKRTLGPRGRNVLISRSYGSPIATKDGVTVAKEIVLDDPFENMGAKMVRDVAAKTNDVAGDGTTTATVLAEAIFSEGLRAVAAGVRPIMMKEGMERAVRDIVANLKQASVPIQGKEDLRRVATIAANNDAAIGEFVSEALERVGHAGVVTLDEGQATKTELEIVKGMQFDSGYVSPYFVTDMAKMECVLEKPMVLIFEKKISHIKDILRLLEKIVELDRPLLIISESIDGDALSTLVINSLQGTLTCCAVKSPGYGDRRKAMLEDISVVVGGKAVFENLGITLESVEVADLGSAQKIIVEKSKTTIIQGGGNSAAIGSRVAQIRAEREHSTSDYDNEKLDERIARLTSGVATIRLGAHTESEIKEKKYLYEDAINAAKASAEEGIVAGGGVALLRAAVKCKPPEMEDDELAGYSILLKACRWPLRCIADNAGKDGGMVCEKVSEMVGAMGYNAQTDRYENLIDTGIIDSTKVVRSALENAASVAILLLTSKVLMSQ